jgi:hypothetical protein
MTSLIGTQEMVLCNCRVRLVGNDTERNYWRGALDQLRPVPNAKYNKASQINRFYLRGRGHLRSV